MLIIDPEAAKELQPELIADEQLIWAGRPKQGVVLSWYDTPFTILSVIWLVFVVNSIGGINFKENPGYILFVFLFGGIGIYITFGRFLWDMRIRKNAFYGLTDRRIIVRTWEFSEQVESVTIKSLTKITKTERLDDSGSIILMNEDIPNLFGMTARGQRIPTLKYIENVKEVYDKISELQKQHETVSKI